MAQKLIKRILLTTIDNDFECDCKLNFSPITSEEWFKLPHDHINFVTLEYRARMKDHPLYDIDYAEFVTYEPQDYVLDMTRNYPKF